MPTPHGGKLIDRVASPREHARLLQEAKVLPNLIVDEDTARDIFNIATGAFSPLEGFLSKEELECVLQNMRLPNDVPWTVPVLLDASEEEKARFTRDDRIVLRTREGTLFAVVDVDEIFAFNRKHLAGSIFGTTDGRHPGVNKILAMKNFLVSGKLLLANKPEFEHQKYLLTPIETRVLFKRKGWQTVAGFQTRNVPHLGHEYVQKTALTFVDGLFINPVIGRKKAGDFKDEVILACYDALLKNYYLRERVVMAILQTEMRYAGPREAIFHAIVRKNFGCTHFIVGRDHAGVGSFYGPYAAQEIFKQFSDLGIVPLFFSSFFYCRKCDGISNEKTCPHDKSFHMDFSGTRLREILSNRDVAPDRMIRPEVLEVLRNSASLFVGE